MRLLRERDGNSEDEIAAVIEWVFCAPDGAFWAGVVESPTSLRKHFPKIWAQMQRPANVVPMRPPSASDLLRALDDGETDELGFVDADVMEET